MTRCSDPGYRILAARSLRKQVKQLAEHLAGVRLGEDIESIHRARVASRRLRAALGMFRACWKRKQVKAWKTQIRQLARNLGEARDHDVLIEFLASSLAGVSDRVLVPGIACLLNHVERQRQWIQPRVLKAIDRFGSQRRAEGDAGGRPLDSGRGGRCGVRCRRLCPRPGRKERSQAAQEVARRVAGACRPGATRATSRHAHRGQAAALHAGACPARLFRRSRPIGSDLANTADAVKKLQTLLGEIHDCDVWVENFEEFARKESAEIQVYFGSSQRFERLRPGLDYLRQERKDRRRQVFGELVAFWQGLKDQGVWDRLTTILEPGVSRLKLQA